MHVVVVFGPLAVGKMPVGREVARLTPYRLLHNHATIDPLLEVFPWGTPAFGTLKREFRVRMPWGQSARRGRHRVRSDAMRTRRASTLT